jgi:hypothetical protein
MASSTRFFIVIGIVLLGVAMLVVAVLGYGEFARPLPEACADVSALAGAGCRRSLTSYIIALAALGVALGALWRRLGR